MKILGISCFYHDSAACLLEDGVLVAAAQEERFTRKKHDQGFSKNAIRYCLAEAADAGGKIDAVAFYEKPILKFHRILESHFCATPRGLRLYMRALPVWLHKKLWAEPQILEALAASGFEPPANVLFPEHHESHAASAFYPSPFDEAALLTVDGVGEWATAAIGVGEGCELRLPQQLSPASSTAQAATLDESMPPLSSTPRGTSAINRRATARRSSSRKRSHHSSSIPPETFSTGSSTNSQ